MSVDQIFEFLTKNNVLPKMLNILIIEYMFSVYKEKKITRLIISSFHNSVCTIKNGKLYTYSYEKDKLTIFDKKYRVCCDNCIGHLNFGFDNQLIHIFLKKQTIHVFNEQCKRVRIINLSVEIGPSIIRLGNMIFTYYFGTYRQILNFDADGNYVNSHHFPDIIYKIQIVQPHMYVLFKNNNILKLSMDYKFIDKYVFYHDDFEISDFCVVDYEIYIFYRHDDQKIYVYELEQHREKPISVMSLINKLFGRSNSYFTRCVIVPNVHKMYSDDNTLYVHSWERIVSAFQREQINLYKKLIH